MLRKSVFLFSRSGVSFRSLASSSDGSDRGPKDPSPKVVLGKDLVDAVDNVVKDLHGSDAEAKKASKSTLLSKLISNEKSTFSSATAGQTAEMMEDPSLLNLLNFVASTNKTRPQIRSPTLARKEKEGIVMLRKEIFYQAKQEGYSAEEAHLIAEKAVEEAKKRVANQRKAIMEGIDAEKAAEQMKTERKEEKEAKLYDAAYAMAEKMLYQEELAQAAAKQKVLVHPDPSLGSFLNSEEKLGVFSKEKFKDLKKADLSYWDDWDLRAAKIVNQSMGPENAFEEQIEWTKKGKQWTYPINNEYLLGEEENVSFIEHIFLERHLPSLGIPKSGPIAHFMHLVCVGLSKNPYMTAAKKMEHLRWFANYFNAEKQKLVHRLHEEEQVATAQSA